jgi:hypothetical protein
MKWEASNPEEYLANTPSWQNDILTEFRQIIKSNLSSDFEETMSYGMIGYVVPHAIYPAGYHCNPKLPLPFLSIAAQKNFVGFYHMGLYADPDLYDWFISGWNTETNGKPDMGKSCLRFKKTSKIPYELLATLCKKMTATQWIAVYEKNFRKS